MERLLRCIVLLAVLTIQIASDFLAPAPVDARARTRITLDAGHGGREIGAAYRFADGSLLREKTVNLQVALLLRGLLEQAGYSVTLTRSTDVPLNAQHQDLNGDGRVGLADELQARVDAANSAGSDLFVSICFDGSNDPSARGTETFWNPKRPFAATSQQLAQKVQKLIVVQLAAAGFATRDRGTHTDGSILGGDSFFLLGPPSSIIARPSRMPAVIVEPLFLTNPVEANALRDSRILSAIAQGLLQGIQATLKP